MSETFHGQVPVRIPPSETLASREIYRDRYRIERDPIGNERLLWRAQSVRHLLHLTPDQTILHFGCGDLAFTRILATVTRNENPITALSFTDGRAKAEISPLPPSVQVVSVTGDGIDLQGAAFDCVVGLEMLDSGDVARTLDIVHRLLVPGGQVVFFESNPWNPWLKLRRFANRLFRTRDRRGLLSRTVLYELFSEVGFIRVFALFTDFVYAPLTRSMIRALRNVSIVAENTPGLQLFAGNVLVHAQKPPRRQMPASPMLCDHPSLKGKISVVVPCHNEEMNIGPLIDRLIELYGDYIHEIIPVDDNSRDSTARVIARYAERDARIRPLYRMPPNGVGRAITDGYRAATGEWILSMDCDFQHLLPEIRDLFDAAAAGADVAVGSRFSRHSILLNYPIMKIISNRAFHFLVAILMGRHLRDLTNNLKLIRRNVADRLVLTSPGFSINAETGLQPVLMGYKVAEVPISWINRSFDMGSSTFKLFRVGKGYVSVLIDILRANWFGSGPYAPIRNIADQTEKHL